MLGTFSCDDQKLVVHEAGQYIDGSPAVRVATENGEPWGTLTAYALGANLEAGEFLVKTYSENSPMREPLLESLFSDTGKRVASGFVELEVWKLK